MEKNLTISRVKRFASVQMVEADAQLVSRLTAIQCTYLFNQELGRDLALRLVKDLAEGLDILDAGFHNKLIQYGVVQHSDHNF